MIELSVLVPVYNERPTIESALRRVLDAQIPVPFEVVIVDDGSTDGSSDVLRHMGAESPDVKLIVHERNRGKGAAIRTALEHASGRLACIHDADLEYEPRDLVRMLEATNESYWDAIYGVRSFGAQSSHSLLYVMGNKFVTGAACILFNRYIRDMMTCYKMMPLELFQSLDLQRSGFDIEAEITGKLLRRGYRIFEVPISYHARRHDEGKKLQGKDAISVLLTLLRTRFARSVALG